jgi:hypothetical protein
MTSNLENSAKRPYNQPTLRVYGEIRTLTGTVGKAGMTADTGLNQPNNKTS